MKLLAGARAVVRWTSLTLLALLVFTPLLQITMRGIFNLPLSGAEELARYFLICLVFIGSSWVTQQGGQIRMEEFQAWVPARPRWLLQLLIDLSGIALFSIVLAAGISTIRNNLDNQTATLEMPFWLFMGPLVLGALMLVIETAVVFVNTYRRHRPEDKKTTLS
ncbi:MAG: TRAP transporter small permease subunit [Casimicrobiaceae bacterium]